MMIWVNQFDRRVHRSGCRRAAVVWAAALMSGWPSVAAPPNVPADPYVTALDGVLWLSTMAQRVPSERQQQQLSRLRATDGVFNQIDEAARIMGIGLVWHDLSIAALEKNRYPALAVVEAMEEKASLEVIAITGVDDRVVQALCRGVVLLIERDEFSQQYRGRLAVPIMPELPHAVAVPRHLARDFGRLSIGTTVEREFDVFNAGFSDLELLSYEASCGSCTTVQLPDEPIAPGGTGTVRVSYTAREAGSGHRSVVISTNADMQRFLYLVVSVDVPPGYRVYPEALQATVHRGEPVVIAIQVMVPAGVEVLELSSSVPVESCDLVFEGKRGGQDFHSAILTFAAADRVGLQQGVLRVHLASEEQPTMEVPVALETQTDLVATPATILLTDVAADDEWRTAEVVIQHRTSMRFQILEARAEVPWVVAEAAPLEAGGWKLVVRIRPPATGFSHATLQVTTDLDGERPMTIDIVARVRG